MSLIENTLFGKIDKVQMAIDRIKMFEPPEGYYLAFSGGKDSQCIYHLTKMAGVKFDAHYNMTGIDPPELVYFIRKYYPEVQRHLPNETMWQLIKRKYLPPTRMVRYCCALLKERGGEGRRTLTGVRWEESHKRTGRKIVEQCQKTTGKWLISPIVDWKVNDVWDFIKSNNLPYCSLYDEGFSRLGCVLCPVSTKENMKKEALRWPKIADAWKRAIKRGFENRINRLGPFTKKKWGSWEDVWEWWFTESWESGNPDQTVMFE